MSAAADERRGAIAELAASALLGALLWDPERIGDVADWLQPQDFRRWGDRAVYGTLVGLRNDGRPIDLLQLPDELAAARYHDAHVQRSDGRGPLTAAALHTYLSITPATPPQEDVPARSEHVRYARLVLDDSIRRQVEALGTRIEQHAGHLAGQDAASAAETLAGVLADVRARLRQLTGRVDEAYRGGSAIAAALNAPAAPAAGRGQAPDVHDTAAAAAPTTRELQRAEYALIGASLISPEVRELAAGRLRARDFATSEAAATWEVIRSLHRDQRPVDVVLVAAEVERQGELPGLGRGLDPQQLLGLVQRSDHAASPVGYRAMETVVRAALIRAVHGGGEQLQTVLGDRAQSSEALLTSAQQTVSEVESTVRRLTGTAPITAALAALTPPKRQIPATRQPGRSAGPVPSAPASAPTAPTARRR